MEFCDPVDLKGYIAGKGILGLESWADIRKGREWSLGLGILPIRDIVEQILDGLVFVHSNGEVHGNLKSSNSLTPERCDTDAQFFIHPRHKDGKSVVSPQSRDENHTLRHICVNFRR